MDKFWSIGVVPIGIVLCFGPALVMYWLTEGKNPVGNEPAVQPAKSAQSKRNKT